MTAPIQDICGLWASSLDLGEPCSDYTTEPTLLEECLQAASNILFMLSARQWPGSCSDTVRPTARWASYGDPMWWDAPESVNYGAGYNWISPGLINGRLWSGSCACNQTNRTGCSLVSEITLGGYPVTQIDEVKIDGAVLDPSQYRIDDYRWLVRKPGSDGQIQGFPCCQDMTKDSTEVDTFEVTYTYGTPPPVEGKLAAATLACELYKARKNLPGCQLPARVQNVARQGVSFTVLDPMVFLEKGKTGLYDVDLFLTSANPKGITSSARVISPDIGRRVRRAGT